jgi:hypothetical protein
MHKYVFPDLSLSALCPYLDYSKKKHKYQVLSDNLYEKNVKKIPSSGKAAAINPLLYF